MTHTPKTNAETVAEFAEIGASPAFIKVIGGYSMLRPEATDWLLAKLAAKDREREAAVRAERERVWKLAYLCGRTDEAVIGSAKRDGVDLLADGHDLTPEGRV